MTGNVEPVPVVELESVDFTYSAGLRRRKRIEALRGVSFALVSGTITGLVGVNGAGKTTLLELIVGALRPSAGVLRRFGREGWGTDAARRIGFCPDVPALPPFLTVREALRLGAATRGLSREAAARTIGPWLERLDLVGCSAERISGLSRGTLVRVGLAQALLAEPDLLLLDESFAPLDPIAQVTLRTILERESSRGAAVLVSSHQLDQLEKVAGEVLFLDRGVLVERVRPSGFRSGSLESILFGTAHEGGGVERTPPSDRP